MTVLDVLAHEAFYSARCIWLSDREFLECQQSCTDNNGNPLAACDQGINADKYR